MAHTTHGHHIPGTKLVDLAPDFKIDCGGTFECNQCKNEVTIYKMYEKKHGGGSVDKFFAQMVGEETNFQAHIISLMSNYFIKNHIGENQGYEIYVVWFAKVLQNYKALVSTTLDDGMYYEVTYDGEKRQTYIDAYVKTNNTVIPD